MASSDQESEPVKTSPSPYGDAAVAACLLVGSIVYFIAAGQEATGTERDLVGQAGFPRAIATVAMGCAAFVLVRALQVWRATRSELPTPTLPRWQPWALWGTTVLYVITLQPMGFVIATTAYVLAGLFILGFRQKAKAALIAIVAAAGLFIIFDILLGVDLPNGQLIESIMDGR